LTTTAPDTLHQRIERIFDSLDGNHDGYVDWSDHQNLVDRYLSAYPIRRDDRRARALQSIHQMLWLELLRHAGAGEDRLLKKEFVAASRLATVDTSRLNAVEGLAHAIFDVADANGDNEITKDEFASLMREVWKVTASETSDAFALVDTDDDGTISRQEFLLATREYFHSNGQDAARSALFGGV
jgi:Ca2+-binding EF-hand superfamily protein